MLILFQLLIVMRPTRSGLSSIYVKIAIILGMALTHGAFAMESPDVHVGQLVSSSVPLGVAAVAALAKAALESEVVSAPMLSATNILLPPMNNVFEEDAKMDACREKVIMIHFNSTILGVYSE